MRETVLKCDICGKGVSEKEVLLVKSADICNNCTEKIVRLWLQTFPLPAKCKKCDGRRKVQGRMISPPEYQMSAEYETLPCPMCQPQGTSSLTERIKKLR